MGEILFPCWSPVLLELGPLQIRWYSLGYIIGFVVAHWILVRLARARLFPLPAVRAGDLVFWLVLGVMLGGRIGYCLFYRPELLASWRVIAVWEGGLSFHGGLLGVILATLLFARRHRVPALRLLDCLALAVTPGIFAVRCANFINGELYGRVTDASVPWAMRFPTDPVASRLLGIGGEGMRDREAQLRAAIDNGQWAEVMDQVPLRHPSQLYEALGEGLLLGLVLLGVYLWTKRKPLGIGMYGALFMFGYGLFRFLIEDYRQPDEQFRDADDPLGTVWLGLTMGQVLCLSMMLVGVVIVAVRAGQGALRTELPPAVEGAD